MDKIDSILNIDRFKKAEVGDKPQRPINLRYEKAQEFGKYVGINTIMVMRLFKLYGMAEVLRIRSWLADCPYDDRKGGKFALAIWKLKEDQEYRKKKMNIISAK